MSSRQISLPMTFLLLAAGGLAACDNTEEYEDGHFYCSDANGIVVDESYCDEASPNYNSGSMIYFMGSSVHSPPAGHSTYAPGTKLPSNSVKMSVTDAASRTRLGLPASGRISNGTVKTGVVGKSGAGSSVKGGSAGGGKSGGG